MKLRVFYDRENSEKTVELSGNSTVDDLLEKMGINPEIVLVSRKKEIILKDEKLNDKDEIMLISVISGG